MPATLTYPGVYIEEISSGVHTITGVATSITAFIGRAPRGPTDKDLLNSPVTINSFGDYERAFGGLSLDSPMSYAVRDFFLNGGSQALIVRLFHPTFATEADRVAAANAAKTAGKTAADAVSASAAAAAAVGGADATAVASATRKAVASTVTGSVAEKQAKQIAADYVAKAGETKAKEPAATAQNVADAAAAAAVKAPDVAAKALAPVTVAKTSVGGLSLLASSPGRWGNSLRVRIDDHLPDAAPAFMGPGVGLDTMFNLSVRDLAGGGREQFLNLTVRPDSPRYFANVLAAQSSLVRAETGAPVPATAPTANSDPQNGADPFSDAQAAAGASTSVSVEASDSEALIEADFDGGTSEADKTGMYALERADLFNILCIPPHSLGGDIEDTLVTAATLYCEKRRAVFLVDPKSDWTTVNSAKAARGDANKNAAIFFPHLRQPNPLRDGQFENFAPCGAVAGIFARTDTERGVWKAPAGLDARLNGVSQLSLPLTDAENGTLNPLGVNCLRSFPAAGRVVWGARTRVGDDRLASEWKYIPVRRTALFIEESLYRGSQWVVFEPNDEPLWAQIRLNFGAFMQDLFRKGAFQGKTPREAYLVKCDSETTTQNDINLGIVNIIVGFAPLKPAEFVVIKLQQLAGQIEV